MPPKRRGGGSKQTSAGTSRTRGTPSPSSAREEVWFSVEDILEESKHQYFVRWGADERDPKTGNRYPDEWIPKEDANERLVAEWEARKRGLPISEINPNIDLTQASQAIRQLSSSDGRVDRARDTTQHEHPDTDSSPVPSSMPLSMALDSDGPEPPDAQGIAIQVPGWSQLDANAGDYSSQVPAQYRQDEDAQPASSAQPQDSQHLSSGQAADQNAENEEGINVPLSSGQVFGTNNLSELPQAVGSNPRTSSSHQDQGQEPTDLENRHESANVIQDSQLEEQEQDISTVVDATNNIDGQPEPIQGSMEEHNSLNSAEKAPSIVISAEDTVMSGISGEVQDAQYSNESADAAYDQIAAGAAIDVTSQGYNAAAPPPAVGAGDLLHQALEESTRRKRVRDADEPPGSPAKRQRNNLIDEAELDTALGIPEQNQDTRNLDINLPDVTSNSLSTELSSSYPAVTSSKDLELGLAHRVRELEKTLSIQKARLERVRGQRRTSQSNTNTVPSPTPGEALPPVVTSPDFLKFTAQPPPLEDTELVTQIPEPPADEDLAMAKSSTANSALQQQIAEHEASFDERLQQLITEHKAHEDALRQEVEKWKAYHAATESEYGKLVQEHLAMEKEHRGFKMNVVTLTKQNETLVEKVQNLTGVISKLKEDLKEEASSSKAKITEALDSVNNPKIPEVAEMEKMRAEVEASDRRLASGQRDMEFIREQYQQASAAAVENNNVISKQEEELTRLRSKAEGEAVKLRAMYEENHMQKERDDAEKAQRRAHQLERSLRRTTEEILEFKKKEAAKGMAAFTRASSNIGSRPASRAVSRRPGSPGPSQLGPGSQRTKARNGTPKVG